MIKTISHYTYEAIDGTIFKSEAKAIEYEKILLLPAVWMIYNSRGKANTKLVFSTEKLAQQYIDEKYPDEYDIEPLRLTIDYQIKIKNWKPKED